MGGPLLALLLSSLAIMGSPGPATISLTAAGSVHGVRRSLGYLAGIVLGTTIVLLAVASGVTAVLLAVPAVGSALIAVSVAYILWLAFHIATAPVAAARDDGGPAPGLRGGTLLGVANPKAWVAIAAVFASAHLASRRSPGRRGEGRGARCDDRPDQHRLAAGGSVAHVRPSRPTPCADREHRACGRARRGGGRRVARLERDRPTKRRGWRSRPATPPARPGYMPEI